MTKSQILNYIYNPAAAKANAWMVKRFKKETFLKALEIYHTESHTAARQYLNYVKVKKNPASNYRKAVKELMKKADLLDLGKRINELYQEYDPFDFEEDMCPPEEIAQYIADKESVILDDLNGMMENCCDDTEMHDRIKAMIEEVSAYYR